MSDDDYKPQDFVYGGKRQGVKSTMAVLHKVNADGTLDEQLAFDAKTLKGKMVGAIYTGASFSPGGAKGLAASRYAGRWPDRAKVMEWEAKNDDTEAMARAEKLEKDEAKVSEIERAMLPLREVYTGYMRRGDFAGKEALERAVLRALRTPLRHHEEPKR